jgi:hypothetical protein
LLVRPRCRWKSTIKIDVKEKGWDKVDWILVDQDKDKWISLTKDLLASQGLCSMTLVG